MSVKANGTDAKEIALHFLNMTGEGNAPPHLIARTISQTKRLLKQGDYTKEEIINVIDFIIAKGIKMYSIGYVSASIADIMYEIEEKKTKEQGKLLKEEQEKQQAELREAVTSDGESARRNAEKARRLKSDIQSRKRKKFDFDMFEGD